VRDTAFGRRSIVGGAPLFLGRAGGTTREFNVGNELLDLSFSLENGRLSRVIVNQFVDKLRDSDSFTLFRFWKGKAARVFPPVYRKSPKYKETVEHLQTVTKYTTL
jgi:hypothetical protein